MIRPCVQGVLGNGVDGRDATAGRKEDEVACLAVEMLGIQRAFRRHHIEYISNAKHIIEMLRSPSACDFLDRHLRELSSRIDQVVTPETGPVLHVQAEGDALSGPVTEPVGEPVAGVQRDEDTVWRQPPHVPHGAGMGLWQGSRGGCIAGGHMVLLRARATCTRSVRVVTS